MVQPSTEPLSPEDQKTLEACLERIETILPNRVPDLTQSIRERANVLTSPEEGYCPDEQKIAALDALVGDLSLVAAHCIVNKLKRARISWQVQTPLPTGSVTTLITQWAGDMCGQCEGFLQSRILYAEEAKHYRESFFHFLAIILCEFPGIDISDKIQHVQGCFETYQPRMSLEEKLRLENTF